MRWDFGSSGGTVNNFRRGLPEHDWSMRWISRSKLGFFRSLKLVHSPRGVTSQPKYRSSMLFRKWTDAEGADAFYIELDGKRLTPEQIQAIAHSEAYKDRLLAFNERLA
jgi:hypothetical protein